MQVSNSNLINYLFLVPLEMSEISSGEIIIFGYRPEDIDNFFRFVICFKIGGLVRCSYRKLYVQSKWCAQLDANLSHIVQFLNYFGVVNFNLTAHFIRVVHSFFHHYTHLKACGFIWSNSSIYYLINLVSSIFSIGILYFVSSEERVLINLFSVWAFVFPLNQNAHLLRTPINERSDIYYTEGSFS